MLVYCRCVSPRVPLKIIRKLSTIHNNRLNYVSSALGKTNKLVEPHVFFATQYRYVRTKGPKEDNDEPKENTKKHGDKKQEEGPEFPKDFKDVENEFRKKLEQLSKEGKIKVEVKKINVKGLLRTAVIIWFAIGLIVSTIIATVIMGGTQPKTDYDHLLPHSLHIPFDVFASKYLPTGEVQRIIHFPFRKIAIAVLYENAIIDGQVTSDRAVIIDCDRLALDDPLRFVEEVRQAEEKLGIQRRDGIHIDHIRDISMFGVISFTLGMAILGWLGFQYFRLIRKNFATWRKGKGGKSGQNPFSSSSGGSST